MGGHGTAVLRGTFNGTSPALGLPIASGESRDSLAVDGNSLCVVSG